MPMCWLSECGRYCVSTATLYMPELTQLESVKSMMRYLAANGTAGLERSSLKTDKRVPAPPAMIMARTWGMTVTLKEAGDWEAYKCEANCAYACESSGIVSEIPRSARNDTGRQGSCYHFVEGRQ